MKRESVKYRAHNEKTCGFERPDGKKYDVDIPLEVKNKNVEWFDWIYPVEKSLTKIYYRELALDELYNIKRDQETYISGFRLHYDIKDDVVEICDITTSYQNSSIYKNIKELFNMDDEVFVSRVKSAIEEHQKIDIKEIKFVDYSYRSNNIKIEI